MPFRLKIAGFFKLNRESLAHKFIMGVGTFLLVDFSWIFFRAPSLGEAVQAIRKSIGVFNPWILFDGSLYNCGLDDKNFRFMIFSILIILFADICKRKGIAIRKVILQQDAWARILAVSGIILFILIFGLYGPGYDAAAFVYFQF